MAVYVIKNTYHAGEINQVKTSTKSEGLISGEVNLHKLPIDRVFH